MKYARNIGERIPVIVVSIVVQVELWKGWRIKAPDLTGNSRMFKKPASTQHQTVRSKCAVQALECQFRDLHAGEELPSATLRKTKQEDCSLRLSTESSTGSFRPQALKDANRG